MKEMRAAMERAVSGVSLESINCDPASDVIAIDEQRGTFNVLRGARAHMGSHFPDVEHDPSLQTVLFIAKSGDAAVGYFSFTTAPGGTS
jgi:hypothetical protein